MICYYGFWWGVEKWGGDFGEKYKKVCTLAQKVCYN